MAQYTMADLEQLVAGQGSQSAQEHSYPKNIPLTNLPSFKRDVKREILLAVHLSKGQMSRKQIAEAVHLAKSANLKRHLDAMVKDGHLKQIPGQHWNGVVKYFYEVAR
jgi:hypothetical protein